jgi:hypothetical protein
MQPGPIRIRSAVLLAVLFSATMLARAEAQVVDGYRLLSPDGAWLVTEPNQGSSAAVQSPPASAKRDSVLNGVLIGAGIGALAGLIPDYYDDCEECHDSLYWSIAVGAGVGLVVDLLRNKPAAPTSTATPGKSVRVGAALGPGVLGLGGRVAWR